MFNLLQYLQFIITTNSLQFKNLFIIIQCSPKLKKRVFHSTKKFDQAKNAYSNHYVTKGLNEQITVPILLTVINNNILMASHTKGLYTYIHSKEVLLIKLFVVIVNYLIKILNLIILVVIVNYLASQLAAVYFIDVQGIRFDLEIFLFDFQLLLTYILI